LEKKNENGRKNWRGKNGTILVPASWAITGPVPTWVFGGEEVTPRQEKKGGGRSKEESTPGLALHRKEIIREEGTKRGDVTKRRKKDEGTAKSSCRSSFHLKSSNAPYGKRQKEPRTPEVKSFQIRNEGRNQTGVKKTKGFGIISHSACAT